MLQTIFKTIETARCVIFFFYPVCVVQIGAQTFIAHLEATRKAAAALYIIAS